MEKNINSMFEQSYFDGNLSKWDTSNIVFAFDVFYYNKNFKDKYNNKISLSRETKEFLEWFEKNREKMKKLNPYKEDVLDFFSFDNLEKEIIK